MSLFFDHASTTPCSAAVLEAMRPFETERFGNPSSAHGAGQAAAIAIAEARKAFAQWFNVEPKQVIFCSGGTEANNLAIQGVALGLLESGAKEGSRRLLYSATEHPAVRETAVALRRLGFDPRELTVDSRGQVQLPTELENVALVSVQQVNNILGTLHPVDALARLVKEKAPSAVFHTDAVQAFGKVPVSRAPSAVDLVSLSAHKIHGPKAVGALIALNPRLKLRPLLFGGGQEGGLRSGTQSAALIAGFHAAALAALARQKEAHAHVTGLRARLVSGLESRGLLGSLLRRNSPDDAVPYIVSLSLLQALPSAAFARLLEEEGCIVSTGSACHSHKPEPELALAAIGLSPELASAGLRISFSHEQRAEDVDRLVDAIAKAGARIRALSGASKPSRRGAERTL